MIKSWLSRFFTRVIIHKGKLHIGEVIEREDWDIVGVYYCNGKIKAKYRNTGVITIETPRKEELKILAQYLSIIKENKNEQTKN